MCVSAKWSTIASKSTLLSKCEKLAIFMAKPHNSNSVIELLFAASGSLLLAYAIHFGLPFCIWYSALQVANLLVSEYKWNLPVLLGICKTGGFISLHLISSNESCCSFPQMNGLPFLVKSYIGFNNFCNSGQNILRKFTIPAKLLHPFAVFEGCSLCITSNLFLKG